MNRAIEDYIKVIYQLQESSGNNKLVNNKMLADRLKHTAQTVNEMIKKLSDKNLVIYKPYKGTTLTDEGNDLAIKILRKHRLWEVFLVEKLGYSWSEVHEEAEVLEHVTSSMLEEKLYDYLERPERCPHGNHIPSRKSKNYDQNALTYDNLMIDHDYKLKRVIDYKDILDYLDKIGLKLEASVKFLELDKLNEMIHLNINDKIVAIGFKVAKNLFFEEILGKNKIDRVNKKDKGELK